LLHLVGLSILLYLIDDARSNKSQVYMHAFTGICTHGLSVQAVRQGMH